MSAERKGRGRLSVAGPTDILSEDVKDLREVNRQLAEEIKRVFEHSTAETRESNHRLSDAINRVATDLSNFRVEIAKELGDFRVEIAKKLGVINANLEGFKGRTENSLAVARWVVAVSVPVLLGLVVWSYSAYARAGHIEDSVTALKDSVTALKDHAKDQDARIGKLIELQSPDRKPPSPPANGP
jgi:hypothetical protein